jgi:hypothetical protein
VSFSADKLDITDFIFDAAGIRGRVDLQLGLPLSITSENLFDIRVEGDDVRNVVPDNDWFEPYAAPFRITALGNKQSRDIGLRNLDLNFGELDVSLAGSVNDTSGEQSAEFRISAIASDLSSLGLLRGRPLPAQALDLSAELSGDVRRLVFRKISGLMGSSDVNGEASIQFDGEKPVINVNAESGMLDLQPFLAPEDADADEPAASTGRLIPDTPLPLSVLEAADIDFSLDVGELKLKNNTFYHLSLRGGGS